MSAAAAQGTFYPSANPGFDGFTTVTIRKFIGSGDGDGHGQTLATGAGALLGSAIGVTLVRRPATYARNPLVEQLREHQNRPTDASVTAKILMPRKASPLCRLQPTLPHKQQNDPVAAVFNDASGAWRINW